MTGIQLYRACLRYKYIAVRDYDGRVYGVNCKIALSKSLRHQPTGGRINYISYRPITLNEYINIKLPIL